MAAIDYDQAIESGEYWLGAAFGLESPQEQMVGAFALGVFIIGTSFISLGWTLLLLWIPIILFFVAVARLVVSEVN
ncbi:hypothetical protein HTZ84_22585 [Haloterrigena sp. SYSU A558-1]|uniref:Uncharacterized protein n=1 Tax=Haloterrigena gelatinilytica TaxID=2741724 RepID=A0ABX2LH65_9EURY|nr:hypothetical protein [Haloterrigena gelatinilytica]NUC75056.1 hypothetical protein [Haloterrigena gelatinilytica]